MNIYQVPSSFRDEHEEKVFWSKIMADQKRSGMGMRQFCRQHQISFSRLAYWKYNKKRKKKTISRQKNNLNNIRQDTDTNNTNDRFVPLQITSDLSFDKHNREISKDKNAQAEILFKSGHKLILPLPVKEGYLFSVIKMLSRL